MAKEMRMVTATHRQCCEIPGCSNRTYTYFTRRDNPSGAIWLCGECVQAMNDIVCPPVPEFPAESVEMHESAEQEPEVKANEAEPVPKEPAKPRKGRGKKE